MMQKTSPVRPSLIIYSISLLYSDRWSVQIEPSYHKVQFIQVKIMQFLKMNFCELFCNIAVGNLIKELFILVSPNKFNTEALIWGFLFNLINILWKRESCTNICVNIIQLLTNEALDMMWYRPDNINIDRGGAEVNIGILWSISHHIQCLISQ